MEKSSNKLVDLSIAFAIEILNRVKYLKSRHETISCPIFCEKYNPQDRKG